MLEQIGNLWDHPDDFRVITTNGIVTQKGDLVMGAGVALEAKTRYPELPKRLGRYVTEFGNKPAILHDLKLITYPTKNHWRYASLISLIEENGKIIARWIKEFNIPRVYLSKVACGNGQLLWADVCKVLLPIFDDRFIVLSRS
ncbi:MAG: hypothetical protein ACHQ1D_00325 [Nitrososphaerales archaeon]